MLDVIYEDNHIIVVIKPQNVPSQKDESGDKDMLTMVKEYIKEKYNKPGEVYCGLVHRLDRPTGGVMVFAKTSKAASRLCAQIQDGDFQKKYLAVVMGKPRLDCDHLVHYLKKDEKNNKVSVATQLEEGSKRCELSYKLIQALDEISLLEVKLYTGRSHQIRVQMATNKTPLFGDSKYGRVDNISKGFKLALWAYDLEFVHPTTKQIMKFKVYPPLEELPWRMFDLKRV